MPLHTDLERWLATRTRAIGKVPVFPDLSSRGIGGAGGLSAQFRKLLAKSGIVGKVTPKAGSEGRLRCSLSFHSLRHSFVTGLLNQGVSADIRKKLAGHASDDVHEIYSHHDVGALRVAVSSLPALGERGEDG